MQLCCKTHNRSFLGAACRSKPFYHLASSTHASPVTNATRSWGGNRKKGILDNALRPGASGRKSEPIGPPTKRQPANANCLLQYFQMSKYREVRRLCALRLFGMLLAGSRCAGVDLSFSVVRVRQTSCDSVQTRQPVQPANAIGRKRFQTNSCVVAWWT